MPVEAIGIPPNLRMRSLRDDFIRLSPCRRDFSLVWVYQRGVIETLSQRKNVSAGPLSGGLRPRRYSLKGQAR